MVHMKKSIMNVIFFEKGKRLLGAYNNYKISAHMLKIFKGGGYYGSKEEEG